MRHASPLIFAAIALAALPAASQTAASKFPPRKPGWWRMAMTISGSPQGPLHPTTYVCVGPGDRLGSPVGVHEPPNCPRKGAERISAGWRFQSECKVGPMTISTEGTVTGNLNSGYSVEVTTRMSPPPTPQMSEINTHIDAKWLGACPAGKKPGDIQMDMHAGPH
ncbi:MAG: DUF3617 domain-containing protein [Caulobacteraceae bacterium]